MILLNVNKIPKEKKIPEIYNTKRKTNKQQQQQNENSFIFMRLKTFHHLKIKSVYFETKMAHYYY